jgi:hypothetical protein
MTDEHEADVERDARKLAAKMGHVWSDLDDEYRSFLKMHARINLRHKS